MHHLTVDVEDYFHVQALEPWVRRSAWNTFERRVARNVARLLDLLAEHDARATFFVLGWAAARDPGMVRAIAAAGHEVASHGWDHRRVLEQRAEDFRRSVRRTKALLEDLTGVPVLGFRAPSFSIVRGCEWALDVLIEEGYRYDSSLYPVRRNGYGYLGGERDVHWVERPAGRLAEVPPTTFRVLGLNVPAGGGAYFRLLPYALTKAALRACERRGERGTFYLHPWELDADQPRLAVSPLIRWRHYGGLASMESRFRRLLREFRFVCIRETLALHGA